MDRAGWIDFFLFLGVLAPIVLYDVREKRIPDVFVLPAIGVFLVRRIIEKSTPIHLVLVTGAAGFSFIFLLFIFSGGKIGIGDAKLSALIALALGLQCWMCALFIASFTGAAFALAMIACGRMTRKERIPFAPFLALGALPLFFFRGFILAHFFRL
jgi:leader peptidase (prepilin peptidase)/N-methyltransferase